MGAPMNPTDAAQVAVFLERQIKAGAGSPEASASLQRVVDHLSAQIKRLTDPVGDGGPAFPCMPPQDTAAGSAVGYPHPDGGMTLRDYFAAAAMAAMTTGVVTTSGALTDSNDRDLIARRAYLLADEMLAVRLGRMRK